MSHLLSTRALSLTSDEEKLFECLDKFVAHVRSSEPSLSSTLEARIAGGWVRDKLLNQNCYDCDVAIADMKGLDFARQFVPFYQRYFDLPTDRIRVAEIKANPDQSKHLDTATVSLLGHGGSGQKIDLDFVQLRSEEYGESSRIPTGVKFGTPLEDAMRRDLTINSLFYNVHTKQVEDYTDKGLVDLLQQPLIRTPLEARQTFLDDPLRILRCIRFAVRLGFPLDPSIKETVLQKDVQDALANKVSRERIGIEIKKMLSGKGAEKAVRMLVELGLYDIVFAAPANANLPTAKAEEAIECTERLHSYLNTARGSAHANSFVSLPVSLVESIHATFEMYLASGLVPRRNQTYTDKRGKAASIALFVASDSLKLGNDESHHVDKLLSAHREVNGRSLRDFEGFNEAASLGTLLNQLQAEKGPSWRESLLFAMLFDLLSSARGGHASERATFTRYQQLVDRIVELELDTRAFAKPILNGNDAQEQGVAGPLIKDYLDEVKRWQLNNEAGTRDDCKLHMKDWLDQHKKDMPIVKKKKRG